MTALCSFVIVKGTAFAEFVNVRSCLREIKQQQQKWGWRGWGGGGEVEGRGGGVGDLTQFCFNRYCVYQSVMVLLNTPGGQG